MNKDLYNYRLFQLVFFQCKTWFIINKIHPWCVYLMTWKLWFVARGITNFSPQNSWIKFLLQKHIWEEMDIQHMFLIEIILPEDQPIFYNWICSWCKLQFRNLLNTRVLQENLMLLYTKKLWFPELAPTEHVIKQWHLKQPTVKKSQLEKFVNIVQRIVQCRISIQSNVELEIKSNGNNKISFTKFDKSKSS